MGNPFYIANLTIAEAQDQIQLVSNLPMMLPLLSIY